MKVCEFEIRNHCARKSLQIQIGKCGNFRWYKSSKIWKLLRLIKKHLFLTEMKTYYRKEGRHT